MVLVDTSIWVDHFRRSSRQLPELLRQGVVLSHSFVIGELACGHLKDRAEILFLLSKLPPARSAAHHEVLAFIEQRKIMGSGIGYVDAHVLAAAALSRASVWTRDTKLKKVAVRLGLGYES
ncbi:MAG: PIN domain-containing protein [Candidatus Omnitrophica bacterium]|nr:PIN domain-containing protein [Candidatus Omnitrophota bacterium]